MLGRGVLFAFLLFCNLSSIATFAGAAETAAVPPVASFSALDNRFEGPGSLAAGLTTIRLQNRGQEPHQLQLLKLTDGRTPEDLASFLRTSHGAMPQWVKHMGGPNGVSPGDTAEAIINLEPGTYVITCAIPNRRQQPHALLKELKTVQVTKNMAPQAEFRGNVHMAMFDYEFVVIQDLHSGPQTFYVVNRGKQTHQVSLVQFNGETSADDILKAFGPAATGPLPGKLLGGMAGLEPGGRGMFTAALSPGRYAMICLFPNPSSHDNHAARGMVMNFTIE